jgi:hypothetical protein
MVAPAGAATAPTVSIALEPVAPGLSVGLHRPDGAGPDYACGSGCILQVVPGRYELRVVDANGHTDSHSLELTRAETIEVRSSHRALAVAGAATAVTGGVLAGVGAVVFAYGAVNNLAASGCEMPCGAVSGRVLRASLAGIGGGLALAAAGAVMLVAGARPHVVRHLTVASIGRLSMGLLPGPGARLPRAFALLRF